MAITFKDGYWWVPHDHKSQWLPRDEWCQQILGPENDNWMTQAGIFAYNVKYENHNKWGPDVKDGDMISPLKWGFKDQHVAFLFDLTWN